MDHSYVVVVYGLQIGVNVLVVNNQQDHQTAAKAAVIAALSCSVNKQLAYDQAGCLQLDFLPVLNQHGYTVTNGDIIFGVTMFANYNEAYSFAQSYLKENGQIQC